MSASGLQHDNHHAWRVRAERGAQWCHDVAADVMLEPHPIDPYFLRVTAQAAGSDDQHTWPVAARDADLYPSGLLTPKAQAVLTRTHRKEV